MTTFASRPSFGITNEVQTGLFITQDGTSSTAVVALTVPTGKFWLIKTANVANPDSTARAVAIQITDGTNVIATVAGDVVTTKATNVQTQFVGDLMLPSGYQIRGNVVSVGAFVPVLQVTGLECNNNIPQSYLRIG